MPRIIESAASVCEVSFGNIISHRRQREFVKPRHIAMYVGASRFFYTLPAIGRTMNRDHTTVLHGVRKIEAELKESPRMRKLVDDIVAGVSTHGNVAEAVSG